MVVRGQGSIRKMPFNLFCFFQMNHPQFWQVSQVWSSCPKRNLIQMGHVWWWGWLEDVPNFRKQEWQDDLWTSIELFDTVRNCKTLVSVKLLGYYDNYWFLFDTVNSGTLVNPLKPSSTEKWCPQFNSAGVYYGLFIPGWRCTSNAGDVNLHCWMTGQEMGLPSGKLTYL